MEINHKSIYYPPGGILVWIIIYLELLTFGLAIFALTYYGAQERAEFHQDSLLLNKPLATINTILLLTSGFFVAQGVVYFRKKAFDKTSKYFLWAVFSGFGFLVLKMLEYYQKLEAGLDMDYSTFFMFYWFLTAFHWVHVLLGIIILLFLRANIQKKKAEAAVDDIEAGATFWHMCDLIWLLLFPILYLLF
ncbi:MAG TPA: cytochrome c oxidase subunit 3 [Flavobacterium sp.]|nr:cytochrome c oxidase subunit 3 [Flavobacterium sp.]